MTQSAATFAVGRRPRGAAGVGARQALPASRPPCQVRLCGAIASRRRVRVLPLEAAPTAPRAARHWLLAVLADWCCPDQVFTAELLVSELVTNAVRHARGPLRLRVELRMATPGGVALRVEMFDGDRTLPAARPSEDDAESGRGLLLVDELAARWGRRRTRHGKLIWFELDLRN